MSTNQPLHVSVEKVRDLIDGGSAPLLLDCRQPEEYAIVHLQDSLLIPMDELPSRVKELEQYRQRQIVVYCHAGVRSEMVARWLQSQGFPDVASMMGGIDQWAVKIDTSLPRY